MAANPGLFSSVDVARTCVRDALGLHGCHMRGCSAHKELFQRPGSVFDGVPEPRVDLVWKPVDIVQERTLVLADLHVPWHVLDVLKPALDYGLARNANCITLLGDASDCFEQSDFCRDRSKEYAADSLRSTWLVLSIIRSAFPKARLIYKLGNHEERWERWFQRHGAEFFEMSFTKFAWVMQHPSAFGLSDDAPRLGIDWIEDPVPLRIAKLWLLHGHEFKKTPYSPVGAARIVQMKAGECIMVGHWHQRSEFGTTTLDDRTVSGWSLGCMCNLHPRYQPLNPSWSHGFAFVTREDDENFTVENKKVIKGKVY